MNSRPAAERSFELSPSATVGLVVLFLASGAIGYTWAGIAGAFFAGLGTTTAAAVAWFVHRTRATDRTRLVEAAPNLDGLAPAQALSVMGAMSGQGAGLSFRSELLTELEAIDETMETSAERALEALVPLATKHPRSPAVHLRRARALRVQGDDELAAAATTDAIAHALDGGMNPMATAIFVEFDSLRSTLTLEERHVRALAKALGQRGHAEQARWCEARIED